MAELKKVWLRIWEYLQEASGERDYAHYLAWAQRAAVTPISRDEFFIAQVEARYSRPNRCC